MPIPHARTWAILVAVVAAGLAWRIHDAESGQSSGKSDANPLPHPASEAILRRASPPPPALTDKPPSSEEWSQWLQSLITAPQGPLLDSVMQVFSRHAGAGQVDALIALYQNEADRAARERIARVLATLASPAALEAVRMVFIHRGSGIDAPLRSACARAMAQGGAQNDVKAILESLSQDASPEFVAGMVSAMECVDHPALEAMLCDAAAGRSASTTPAARVAAIAALANYPSVPVTEVLHAIASGDPDKSVRERAGRSLAILRSPE